VNGNELITKAEIKFETKWFSPANCRSVCFCRKCAFCKMLSVTLVFQPRP